MQRSLVDRLYFVDRRRDRRLRMLLSACADRSWSLIISFTGGITLKFPPPSWSMRWYCELLALPGDHSIPH